MDTATIKKQILNATAITGSRSLAISQIEYSYTDFLDLINSDPAFKKQVREAESFYTTNLNRVVASLGKQRLWELLTYGEKVTSRKTTSLYNDDGEMLTKTEVTITEKGVPVSAIKLALECLPELVKVAEQLVSHNALETDKVEAVESTLESLEDQIRASLNGSIESKSLTDEVLAMAQNIFLNGG